MWGFVPKAADDQVAAASHQGNGLGLNRRGRGPAQIVQGRLDIVGEFGKKFRKFSHIEGAGYRQGA